MQQSAYEHAALIWTRPSNTIRALRHVERRIMRPETCQHPMTRQDQLQNPSCAWGGYTCCTNPVWDSSHESSVVAGIHEQTYTPDLQDQELASLQ